LKAAQEKANAEAVRKDAE